MPTIFPAKTIQLTEKGGASTMKKTDIAMIVLIASVSVLVAFFIINSLPFLKVSSTGEKAKSIDEITTKKLEPDTKVFTQGNINPTVETIIGGS